MIKDLFYFIVFPGMIFSVLVGGILSWSDRKITARVQFRKGPPFLQPFYDLGKLFYKETILPKYGAKFTFLAAPVFALFSASLANVFILLPSFFPDAGFRGDIIVIIIYHWSSRFRKSYRSNRSFTRDETYNSI